MTEVGHESFCSRPALIDEVDELQGRRVPDNASLSAELSRQGLKFNAVNPAPFRAQLAPYFKSWQSEFGPTVWGLLENALGRRVA